MTATVVLKLNGQFKRVPDCSTEYFALTAAGWDIDDIIGETDDDVKERAAAEARAAVIAKLDADVEAIEAAARAMGYAVETRWANESSSRYIMCDSIKVRVSDHSACYACDISVDPTGLNVADAIEFLRAELEAAE